MRRTGGILTLCLLFSGILPVFAFAQVTAWFAPGTTKVLRDAKPDTDALQWELSAARNETEACQLVLLSEQSVGGAKVTVSDFRCGPSGATLCPKLYKVEYVPNVVGDTPYPDPLPPLGPLDLQPNSAQPVWISVRVPKEATPGAYEAAVHVEANNITRDYPIRLKVWDFILPGTPSCETAFGLDLASIARQHGVDAASPEAKLLYAKYYEMLLDHHISAYTIPADLMSDDAEKYLTDPRMTSYMLPYSEDDGEIQKLAARLAGREYYAKGYFYATDEPVTKEAYGTVDKIAERLRRNAPGYRWVVPFFRAPEWTAEGGGSLTAFDLMLGKVNLWCPISNYFDSEPRTRPFLAERRQLGEKVWWYVCCGPGAPYNNFFVDMSAMSHRMLFWQQKRENVQGLLYWNTTYWNPACIDNPWTSMMTVKDINALLRGDGSLLYPGKQVGVDGPVSSQRLEVIRDGLEDFDYLTLAGTWLGEDVAQRFAATLARTLKDWEQDPKVLEKVRCELAAMLEQKAKSRE